MTLIAGVKLPKGVLLVSDTREILDDTEEIVVDSRRKITNVVRGVFMGTSGHESTSYVANILRNCFYNASANSDFSREYFHQSILKLYETVSDMHFTRRHQNYPIGSIIIAEYVKESSSFNLFHAGGLSGFTSFDEGERTYVIGSKPQIRNNVKERIEIVLNNTDKDTLNIKNIYINVAKKIQEYFQQEAKDDISVGEKVYCTYVTQLQNQPASDTFILSEDGLYVSVDPQDNNDNIKELEN
ncbi:Ntn hydrolase family protein [Priestia flexa]|uniref:hypothetical protein n=1 Tax=Priestia flexa TaxID=86664 RepID=UPI001CFD8018|nr:hypothetical protein [Priestia flexa]